MKKKDSNSIGFLEEASFEKDNEEAYLHKLLEENPRLLSGSFDTKAVLLKSKLSFSSGDEADMILCEDTGDLTIVELKRGRAPRDAIAQLLDYASLVSRINPETLLAQTKFKTIAEIQSQFGIDNPETKDNFEETFKKSMVSPKLMLVSYDIPDDIKRVADWLRTKKIMINCVEFDYYTSEEHELFIPRIIGSEETAQIRTEDLTESQKLRLEFFTLVLKSFKDTKPGITNKEATFGYWMSVPCGYTDIHFEWNLKGRGPNKEILVCLDFENDDIKTNQNLLQLFKEKSNEFKERIGEELHFEHHGKGSWMRIYAKKPIGAMEKAKEKGNVDWAVTTMSKFYEILRPSLDKAMQR